MEKIQHKKGKRGSQGLTRRQKLDKRKGRMGHGWGKARRDDNGSPRYSKPSPHIFATERWVVTPPANIKQRVMAFLSEKRATEVAIGIANNHDMGVEIDHQVMNENGEWVSAPDEE